LADARANCVKLDEGHPPPAPNSSGVNVFDDISISELRNYIDWTPFFSAWQLNGAYPRILDDEKKGEEARKIFTDAQTMLDRIVAEKWFTAKAVIGLFPANATDDDSVIVYSDESRSTEVARLHFLRQQQDKKDSRANLCLADFVARNGADHMGGFAVSIFGAEAKATEFQKVYDDYHAIMVKVLADRLAEALAEMIHEKVRQEHWGYEADGGTSAAGDTTSGAAAKDEAYYQSLVREKYQGIRPAAGYPACPEHTEKGTLWQLLDAEKNIGTSLTESYAMNPPASVSGLYFASPEAKYFTVGNINREQVQDYAKRKGMSVEEAEKWLGPILGY
ncbi:MAG: methionine synthase, partial [Gammaproteobacteria bacterium]|nr:methionine synthase [Gammaproteobacteria bacterium]